MRSAIPPRQIDKFAGLRETNLFRDVSEDVVRQAAQCAVVRHIPTGQVLFTAGDRASGIYFVLRGQLRSIRQNPAGREQVLSIEGPGAVLAVAAVMIGGTYHSTTIADSNTDVLCLPSAYVLDLCRKYPELLWNITRVLAGKICHYVELIETLALCNVDQRLAQCLFSICHERATRNGDVYVLEMSMTQAEIASLIGSTREVVCRALSRLQKSGLIHLRGKLLRIPDAQALRKFAGTEQALEQPRFVSELSSQIA
jgi:CRP/FNR family transcriptional regulator